jgi:hypothetical protein
MAPTAGRRRQEMACRGAAPGAASRQAMSAEPSDAPSAGVAPPAPAKVVGGGSRYPGGSARGLRRLALRSTSQSRSTKADREAASHCRARRTQPAVAAIRWRRRRCRRRAQHWRDAVTELVTLQSEYAHWFEACPSRCGTPPPAKRCSKSRAGESIWVTRHTRASRRARARLGRITGWPWARSETCARVSYPALNASSL